MVAKILTGALLGIESSEVEVQVRIRPGKDLFSIIGLADTAVREARDRVAAALTHVGVALEGQVLVNLSPAELKKEGSGFDLAIAVGILAAMRLTPNGATTGVVFQGELALDGSLKSVRGCLSCAILSRQRNARAIVVPFQSQHEAALVPGLRVLGFRHLRDVVRWLREGLASDYRPEPRGKTAAVAPSEKTFEQVRGQQVAKRALLVAAAGGHHMLMVGPPGCGKSMLAERFPLLFPTMKEAELLEAARNYSAAGLSLDRILTGVRPFRSPHHSISEAGLVGGGTLPRPGEVSLAHRGVLFLDELPEFRRAALEALRGPLESGIITLSRARGQVTLPAKFQLIAAMNPCPCGRLGISRDDSKSKSCMCSRTSIESYLKKTSQPILDRIDLQVELQAVATGELFHVNAEQPVEQGKSDDLSQERLAAMVQQARERQYSRQGKLNTELQGQELQRQNRFESSALTLLERGSERLQLSARGVVRSMRVSATIADIEGVERVSPAHVAEALQYRALSVLKQYAGSEYTEKIAV